eukprot:4186729-Amphidinium_carterae.1
MQLCVLLSAEDKERTKHTMTRRKRIQEAAHEHDSESIYDEPPGLAHSPPGGRNQYYEHVKEVKLMTCRMNRT